MLPPVRDEVFDRADGVELVCDAGAAAFGPVSDVPTYVCLFRACLEQVRFNFSVMAPVAPNAVPLSVFLRATVDIVVSVLENRA